MSRSILGLLAISVFLPGCFDPGRRMPLTLKTPSVIQGDGRLAKSVFLDRASLGKVSHILHRDEEIGIAGTRGAVWVDLNGKVNSSVRFDSRGTHVEFLELDGAFWFLNRGGHGWQNASLIDPTGRTKWTYGGSPGINDMAGGDLNGDGTVDFVVGHNGDGGVHLVDGNGDRLWRQPDGNVWHVELVDTDGDGTLEIVHSNAGGRITIRDQDGQVIRQATPDSGVYFSDFSLCHWPTRDDPPRLLLAGNDYIWLFDFDGVTVAKLEAPDCQRLGWASGTVVRLPAGDFLAVLVSFDHWNRSVLYVYDDDESLVYQEVLGEASAAVAAVPLADSSEALLVGGTGKVWKYTGAGPERAD